VRSSKNLFFAPLQEKVKKGFKGQKKSIKVVQAKVKKPLGKKKFIALVRKHAFTNTLPYQKKRILVP